MDDAFGNWLAGFIDGEGSFLIRTYKRSTAGEDYTAYGCQFTLGVRRDDEPILREIHEQTGIGRVYVRDRGRRGQEARWEVKSRAECGALIELLRRYPLRAKKARDLLIWAQAVTAWGMVENGGLADFRNAEAWLIMGELRRELRAVRGFDPEGVFSAVALTAPS